MFVIRRMTEEDLPSVAAIEKESFTQPWSESGFRSSLRSQDTMYLVADGDGKILGYTGLLRTFEEADITNVCVAYSCRGKGIGQALVAALMSEGRKAGIRRFTLEVRKSNSAAIHIYEKLGFHSVGFRKRFYSYPVEDACIMWTEENEIE